MSTNTSSADYGRFEDLAEEFAARFRRGERPSLQEYIDRCPDLADEIRELFPALVEVERVKDEQPARPGAEEAAAALPLLGQVGDYRVLREVGRGGMGVVYEAEQVSLGRRVALKVLPRQISKDVKMLARFRREARSAAQLHHTNIVPVFEVGKDGEVSYYAMQFIQGQGLDTVIDELRRLKERAHPIGTDKKAEQALERIPPGSTLAAVSRSRQANEMALSLLTGRFVSKPPSTAERNASAATDRGHGDGTGALPTSNLASANVSSDSSSVVLPGGSQLSAVESGGRPFYRSVAQVARQVASGLAYANARGILHRDIKPSNLLLDNQGVVWISDFGLAKASDDGLTQTGDVLGTVRYMAPERFRGEGDGRADIYALGLTLYELLTLRPAFDVPDRLQLIEQIKAEDPPRPRALDPRIPRDLETIVFKAIAKDPKDRYPTADDLGEDLRRFLADEPIRARRVGPLERALIWAKRRPAVAGLFFVSGVAVAALGVVVIALGYNSRLKGALQQTEQAKEKAEAASKEAETQRYFHHIAVADAEWRDGNAGRVEPLLEDCPRIQRNWEWRYLKRSCHPELLNLKGYTGGSWTLAFSPDGSLVAAGGIDHPHHTVKIWDATTGRFIRSLPGHSQYISEVVFSPDGKLLAAGSGDSTVRVWDVATGREIYTLPHSSWVWNPVFSPDGHVLASASSDGTVRFWNLDTGKEVRTVQGPTHCIHNIAFSPDGMRLASGRKDFSIALWDPQSGRVEHRLEGHSGVVWDKDFSPDGRWLASGSADKTVRVWETATGRLVHTLRAHSGEVWCVRFSPDGTRLASGAVDQSIRIWDAASGQELCVLRGHSSEVYHVAFSPDGTRLASTGEDGSVRIWSGVVTRAAPTLKGNYDEAGNVAFSRDGAWLAAGANGNAVRVWDATTGQTLHLLQGHSGHISSVAFSRDGKHLASASHDLDVCVWDAATGQLIRILQQQSQPIWSVVFSPDGQSIAGTVGELGSGIGKRGKVCVWDVTTGRTIHTIPGQNYWTGCGVAFSPDGKRLALAGDGFTVRLCEVSTGRELSCLPGNHEPITTISFSPLGDYLAAAGWAGPILLWNAKTGQPLSSLIGHTSHVWSLAFSPDGTRLASASRDQTVKVWDLATYQEVISLKGHSDTVRGVDFSADGARIASAGCDGKVQVWDARLGNQPTALAEREALGLLDFLFTKPLCKADVRHYLGASPTISQQARQIALSLLEGYHEEKDSEAYQQASWAIVRQPHFNAFQYRFALLQAEHACRLAPDRQDYRIGLGAALYRAGRYREVIETLKGPDRLGKASLAILAFLAMTHQQLGQHEQARANLAILREIVDQPGGTKDAGENLGLVHEAETLVHPDHMFPVDPFAR
jgi:WD40 repeat protein/serine/threonine protein kinase